jgi:hypothetical protein
MAEVVTPVQGLVEAWRDEFPGSALQSGNWEVRKVGVGMSYSVASSKLTIATGVTSGDVLELISKPIRIKPPVRLFVSLDSISQRIANQEFSIELIRSDTLVDAVNTDSLGFYLFGTNATFADMRSFSQGDASAGLLNQSIVNTSGASLFEIDLTTDEAWFYNGSVDVDTTTKTLAKRMTRKVPDPAQTYMVRLRAKNTGTAASTTNFVIDSVLVEDYTHLGVEIARSRGSSAAGEQLPVVLPYTVAAPAPVGMGLPLTQSDAAGGSVTSPAAIDTTIVVSSSLAAGTYDCELSWSIKGTAETLPLNLKTTATGGATSFATLPSLPGDYKMTFISKPTSTANIYLRTNAAATAGAVYSAILRTTRIG